MIIIGDELERQIRAEGEKAYPNECCGVLLGREVFDGQSGGDGRVLEAIIPINNARETEEQYHRFRIEPEDLMMAEKAARRQNRDVLGFYHSHPDHPAKPSGYDQEYALPFYSYIIVEVKAVAGGSGKAAEMTSWTLTADREKFEGEAICNV